MQERADHIAEWVRLTAEKEKPAQVAPGLSSKAGHQRQQGGINAAVRDLGIDRTEAQRAVKIASLAPEAKEAARATSLDDKQSVLLAAARELPIAGDTDEAKRKNVERAVKIAALGIEKVLRGGGPSGVSPCYSWCGHGGCSSANTLGRPLPFRTAT